MLYIEYLSPSIVQSKHTSQIASFKRPKMRLTTFTLLLVSSSIACSKLFQVQINLADRQIDYSPDSNAVHRTKNFKSITDTANQPFKLLVVDSDSLEPIKHNNQQYYLALYSQKLYRSIVSLIPGWFAGYNGNFALDDGKLVTRKSTINVRLDGLLVRGTFFYKQLKGVTWDVVEGENRTQHLVPVVDGEAFTAGG